MDSLIQFSNAYRLSEVLLLKNPQTIKQKNPNTHSQNHCGNALFYEYNWILEGNIDCVWWSWLKSAVTIHWIIDPELLFFVILLIWTIKSIINNLKKKLFCLVFFGANMVNLKKWELDLLHLPKIIYSIRKYQSIEISDLNPMSRFF